MQTPYIIYGTVYQKGTTQGSASNNITLRDETSNEIISTVSNSLGQFIFDLANLKSGYTDGDFIRITPNGGLNNGQILLFKAVCKREHAQIENLDVKYEV